MALFGKILFPTDFSTTANNALSHALRMGNLDGTELIVQHVVSDYFERHPQWATIFDVHELEKKLDFHAEGEMADMIPAEARGKLKIQRVLSKGRTDEAIDELAEKEMVDIIVMGPATGAMTGKVIRRTLRPVLSVPKATEGKGVRRMLVATDFSDHSKKVIDYAFDLKKQLGCALEMVHVIDTPMWLGNMIDPPAHPAVPNDMIEWAKSQLKNLTPHEFLADPSVERFVDIGSPSGSLEARIQARKVDLVILGAHGHGPVQHLLVGTTTEKLLGRALCPVLTVRT